MHVYYCDNKTPQRDALKEREEGDSSQLTLLVVFFLEVEVYVNFLGVAYGCLTGTQKEELAVWGKII